MRSRSIGEVCGLDPMIAVEFFKDKKAREPAPEHPKDMVTEAAKRGLILLSCGIYGNVVRILVPLTGSDAILDEGLDTFEASYAAVVEQPKAVAA